MRRSARARSPSGSAGGATTSIPSRAGWNRWTPCWVATRSATRARSWGPTGRTPPCGAGSSGGGGGVEAHGGTVLGADGAYSAVRGRLQRRERFDYSQMYLAHGYRELHIAPGPKGAPRLEPHALHIWPRGGYMMMAMANRDGSFTGQLYLAFEGPNS